MIERVARAIFESEYNGGEADEYRWERSKDAYFNQARAAIEAMREPTRRMLIAGENEDSESGATGNSEKIYEAMIDEALK